MRKHRYTFIILFVFGLISWVPKISFSQEDATPLLHKLMSGYESIYSLKSQITLIIDLPEQEPVKQKATIYQKDKKFRVESDNQLIVSDGKTVWTYTAEDNRVVLTFAEDGTGSMNFNSPYGMMKEMVDESELRWITDYATIGKRKITKVELKPKDRDAEFFKVVLSIDETKLSLLELQTFSKDGSNYTIHIEDLAKNMKLADGLFVFDKSKYPGIEIEDLRI